MTFIATCAERVSVSSRLPCGDRQCVVPGPISDDTRASSASQKKRRPKGRRFYKQFEQPDQLKCSAKRLSKANRPQESRSNLPYFNT